MELGQELRDRDEREDMLSDMARLGKKEKIVFVLWRVTIGSILYQTVALN